MFIMEDTSTPRQTPETAPSPIQPHSMREPSRTPSMSSEPECPHSNNQCYMVNLFGVQIAALIIDSQERLCLAQISNTLLKKFSYNEIHNRRVALGITCVQCTPVQLEILRRANAMPVSSRRCGMINKREAERLCKSFLTENRPPKLPENFSFEVYHECTWGCQGAFVPSRYNSSRAKCIRCSYCSLFSSPNKFIFHAHRMPNSKFHPPDGPNFNSWRRHIKLVDRNPSEELLHAWEDVKAMFNGGSRKRSVCESSSKMPSTSFGCTIDNMSRSSSAQRLLPSPPKRARYDHEASHEHDLTPIAAANVPYPLMPIPNRSAPSSFADTLPEDPPVNSVPAYPVNVFHGQLSPSSFRQHPFMEFLWSGGRAGCPLPSATLWPKTIGMPFVSNASYYQPLMGPDSDIHTVIDQGSPTNTPSKKTTQWDDFDSKYGSVKPKGVSNRHQYLPDFRKAAYYTSAFRPVITSKGCLDPERAFSNAERIMFPPKSVPEECFIAAAQDHRYDPLSYKTKHHQVLTQDDQSKPSSLNHLTRKPVPEVDLNDKHDESSATVKRTPSSRGSGSADAGADLPDERGECLRERLDLDAERPQRTTPVSKIQSPRESPDTLLAVGLLPPSKPHIIKACPTPSQSSEDEEHAVHSQTEESAVESVAKFERQYRRNVVAHQLIAREHQLSTEIELRRNAYLTAQQKYRENQGALNHFSRHILSSHGTCMD